MQKKQPKVRLRFPKDGGNLWSWVPTVYHVGVPTPHILGGVGVPGHSGLSEEDGSKIGPGTECGALAWNHSGGFNPC